MLQLDRTRHIEVKNCELLRWLKREFPLVKDIMVYRHQEHKTTVVGLWVSKDRGIIQEVVVISNEKMPTGEELDILQRRLRKGLISDRAQILKFVTDYDDNYMKNRQRDTAETKDLYRFVRRHLKNKAERENPMLRALAGD